MEELIKQIERELLYQIIFSLQNSETSVEEAKNLANDFLAELPISSEEEMYQKLSKLGEKYDEARKVFLKHGVPLEEKKTQEKIAQLQKSIEEAFGKDEK
jgi:hypothetical protein